MNKGNPYKKNNGRFGSIADHDYILYEPNKEKDIARNEAEVNGIKKQHSTYNPIDLTNRNIGTKMQPTFKDSTQKQYANLDISRHKDDIAKVDLNNEQAVVDLAREIINEPGVACFRTAAGVARILDERGIKYKIKVGYAEIPKTHFPVKDIKEAQTKLSNHVWVQTENDKIYSWFSENYSNTTKFYTVTDIINIERK